MNDWDPKAILATGLRAVQGQSEGLNRKARTQRTERAKHKDKAEQNSAGTETDPIRTRQVGSGYQYSESEDPV